MANSRGRLTILALSALFLGSCDRPPAPAQSIPSGDRPPATPSPAAASPATSDALPSKKEWLSGLLSDHAREIDLVEAVLVLVNATVDPKRNRSDLLGPLEPALRRVRMQVGPRASADEKIDALNRELLPDLKTAVKGNLRWLADQFSGPSGHCVTYSVVYAIAAETLSLKMDPVRLPQHVFLTIDISGRRRNVEMTQQGASLTLDQYRDALAKLAGPGDLLETLPEGANDLEKMFRPLTRREFVALLLCQLGGEVRDFQAAARLAPGFYVPPFALGIHEERVGRLAEAERAYTEGLQAASFVPLLFARRAVVRSKLGKLDSALEDAESALRLSPSFANYYGFKADLLVRANRLGEALDAVTRALELDPKDANLWALRSFFREKSKHFPEAIQDLDKAIELRPAFPEYYESRARLWAMQGDQDRSNADRQKANELRVKK